MLKTRKKAEMIKTRESHKHGYNTKVLAHLHSTSYARSWRCCRGPTAAAEAQAPRRPFHGGHAHGGGSARGSSSGGGGAEPGGPLQRAAAARSLCGSLDEKLVFVRLRLAVGGRAPARACSAGPGALGRDARVSGAAKPPKKSLSGDRAHVQTSELREKERMHKAEKGRKKRDEVQRVCHNIFLGSLAL